MSFTIADKTFHSRLLIGSALYPSPEIMQQSIQASGAEIVTVALKRQSPGGGEPNAFWELIQSLGLQLLPNTAGCRNAKEAVTLANMAREIFNTNWIKLEVIGDDYTLQTDPIELVAAARELNQQGFTLLPYCSDDLVVCHKLIEAGCNVLMPWGAPIGSGIGLANPFALETIRQRLPEATLIVDAGIGKPSHAAQAMEMGFDAVLLNSAIALAENPVTMASAFAQAIDAGRKAYASGMMPKRQMASASTPLCDTPFWHQDND